MPKFTAKRLDTLCREIWNYYQEAEGDLKLSLCSVWLNLNDAREMLQDKEDTSAPKLRGDTNSRTGVSYESK